MGVGLEEFLIPQPMHTYLTPDKQLLQPTINTHMHIIHAILPLASTIAVYNPSTPSYKQASSISHIQSTLLHRSNLATLSVVVI